MKLPIFEHLQCEKRIHCQQCKSDPAWRKDLEQFYLWPNNDKCPFDSYNQNPTPYENTVIKKITKRQSPDPFTLDVQHNRPKQILTPEQTEKKRLAQQLFTILQSVYKAAGGEGQCSSCGDKTVTLLYKMYTGNIEAMIPEIKTWLENKVPLTEETWSKALNTMQNQDEGVEI